MPRSSVPLFHVRRSRDSFGPCGDLFFRLVLRHAIKLADSADEQFAVAPDEVEVLFGELGPLLPDDAPELQPIACDLFPVHGRFRYGIARAHINGNSVRQSVRWRTSDPPPRRL